MNILQTILIITLVSNAAFSLFHFHAGTWNETNSATKLYHIGLANFHILMVILTAIALTGQKTLGDF